MVQRRCWVFLALLIMSILVLQWPRATLATRATLSIAPARVEIGIGETCDIEVLINNVSNLYGADVIVTFEPTIVECVDLVPDREGVQIRPGQFPVPDFLAENEVINDFGTIWYAASQVSPRGAVSGSGTVMTIRFRGKSPGRTEIRIIDVTLSDPGGLQIAVESTTGGEVVVLEPRVTPRQISPTPTLSPVATFTGTPSPTQGQPTATLERTLTASPTQELPSTPTATPLPEAYPATTPTGGEAYPLLTPVTPQSGNETPVIAPSATIATEQATRIAEPTDSLVAASATPPSPTDAGPAQPTTTPAKVAAVIPTLRPASRIETQQTKQEPLIPERVFIGLAALLVLVTAALLLYLIRRAKEAS